MQVGWIGVGVVGQVMVQRALAEGHQVLAYDRGAGRDVVKAAGARLSGDYAEVAAFAEVLGVCVFHDGQVRDTLVDAGVLSAMRPGSVVANHTTGSPELAVELAGAAPPGVEVLDATFSGSPKQAAAGELTLLVGGTEAGLERARPVLETYARLIHLVGPHGRGQSLKLLNNLLYAANARYAGAILELAEQQGFSAGEAAAILATCSAGSFALQTFVGVGDLGRVQAGSRRYLLKDASAAYEVAHRMGLDCTPFREVLTYFGVTHDL